eukprot:CAMPEP_0173348294 /NCGR_PEP_ID=MMETSP1144-20121109/13651_1 /TAXON_ID=483371 /ORGANISM="non described non described, Strain CCMP2298" /LENGTH=152 /DNA_ID=CAMNT_0014295919 /DNA_START=78 /DNA_END=533 /DNA_ORIENTATION=+
MKSRPSTKSFTKPGELYIHACNDDHLFPLDVPPSQWSACHDANEFTWDQDYSHDLAALSPLDRVKRLAQRASVRTTAASWATSPPPVPASAPIQGLCYTKLENGGKSFGACCFTEGAFNSGRLLGYADKCINNPKPIYKHSRVVLGDQVGGT